MKCTIEDKSNNFKSILNIYKEMLLAWADMDITHNTDSYPILYESILDYTHLSNNNTVRDGWNVGTDDFNDWARLFNQQAMLLPNRAFPHTRALSTHWLRASIHGTRVLTDESSLATPVPSLELSTRTRERIRKEGNVLFNDALNTF